MSTVLIQFAHPALEKSKTNRILIDAVRDLPSVTINDLYEQYPDFDIDIDREQDLLLRHDYILLHHPLYWYSAPAIVKQWEDLTLEHGWAYGRNGNALVGKKMMNIITSGGPQDAYTTTGFHQFTLRQFLTPFERTATLCKMVYLPPFVVHGTHRMDEQDVIQSAQQYRTLVQRLITDDFDVQLALQSAYVNELLTQSHPL